MSINNFGVVDDLVYRMAEPTSQQDFAFLFHTLNVRNVIKLTTESETPLSVEQAKATPRIRVTALKVDLFRPTEIQVRDAVKAIVGAKREGSVAVHCLHGRDRTGLVCGAYRLITGQYTLEAVLAEREDYGVEGLVEFGDKLLGHDSLLADIAQSLVPK